MSRHTTGHSTFRMSVVPCSVLGPRNFSLTNRDHGHTIHGLVFTGTCRESLNLVFGHFRVLTVYFFTPTKPSSPSTPGPTSLQRSPVVRVDPGRPSPASPKVSRGPSRPGTSLSHLSKGLPWSESTRDVPHRPVVWSTTSSVGVGRVAPSEELSSV